jgi:hypothetical protein
MECQVCQREVRPGDAFCESCGAQLSSAQLATGWSPPASQPSVAAAPPLNVASNFSPPPVRSPAAVIAGATLPGTPLVVGDGEMLWRQYEVSQLRTREHGQGILFVTDARVVFYARAKGRGTQRGSALVQQTKIGDITGMSAFVSHRVSLGWLITTAILGLLTLSSLAGGRWGYFVVFGLLLGVAIVMLVRGAAKRGSVGVMIHGASTQQSPISFGQFGETHGLIYRLLSPLLGLLGVHTAFDVLIGFPGRDAEQVIAELGALIFDLQSRGSLAGTHWGVAGG